MFTVIFNVKILMFTAIFNVNFLMFTIQSVKLSIVIDYSVLLTSELNGSQLERTHYYNFSDLRGTDGAR